MCPAPDFPTGGLILGHRRRAQRLHTPGADRSSCARAHVVEEGRGDQAAQIVLTEIPYQVGKNAPRGEASRRRRRTSASRASVGHSRRIQRASAFAIVIDLKRDATPDVVLNQLWRHTSAQSSFPANMLGVAWRSARKPSSLQATSSRRSSRFREEVITRRSKYQLMKARERAHILLGLVVAVTNLDQIVRIIRGSASPAEARGAPARCANGRSPRLPGYIASRGGGGTGSYPRAIDLQIVGGAGSRHPRSAIAPPHRARAATRSVTSLKDACRARSRELLEILGRSRPAVRECSSRNLMQGFSSRFRRRRAAPMIIAGRRRYRR